MMSMSRFFLFALENRAVVICVANINDDCPKPNGMLLLLLIRNYLISILIYLCECVLSRVQ